MIEIRTGRCLTAWGPRATAASMSIPSRLDRAWHRPRPASWSAPPSEIMVGAELQDQLASLIGVRAEAHDVAETPAPAARGAAPGARRHRRRAGAAGAAQVGLLYGARPLRRLVQSAIGYQLARRLLAGEIRDGTPCRVDLDAAADRLTVTRG